MTKKLPGHIEALSKYKFKIMNSVNLHFRIEDLVDYWPTTQKFLYLKSKRVDVGLDKLLMLLEAITDGDK